MAAERREPAVSPDHHFLTTLYKVLHTSEDFNLLCKPWFVVQSRDSEWDRDIMSVQTAVFQKKPLINGKRVTSLDMHSVSLSEAWIDSFHNSQASGTCQVPLPRLCRGPNIERVFAMLLPRQSSGSIDGALALIEHFAIVGRTDDDNPPVVVDLLEVNGVTAIDTSLGPRVRFSMRRQSESQPERVVLFPYSGIRAVGSVGPPPGVVARFLQDFAKELQLEHGPRRRALARALASCFDEPLPGRSTLIVCGMISAGKSTFLNALLGTLLFPVQEAAETLFPTKVTFSDRLEHAALLTLQRHGAVPEVIPCRSVKEVHDLLKRPVVETSVGCSRAIEYAHVHLSVRCCSRADIGRLGRLDLFEVIDLPGRGEERDADFTGAADDNILMNALRKVVNPIFVVVAAPYHLHTSVMKQFLSTITKYAATIKKSSLTQAKEIAGLVLVRSSEVSFPHFSAEGLEKLQRDAQTFAQRVGECGLTISGSGIYYDSKGAVSLRVLSQFEQLRTAGFRVDELRSALLNAELVNPANPGALHRLCTEASVALEKSSEIYHRICQRPAATQSVPPIPFQQLKEMVDSVESSCPKTFTWISSEVVISAIWSQIETLVDTGCCPPSAYTLADSDIALAIACTEVAIASTLSVAGRPESSIVSACAADRDVAAANTRYKVIGIAVAGGILTAGAAYYFAPAIGAWFAAPGLYGAAATSSGLATLGGGSLASGGFGMAGGIAVISSTGAVTGAAGAGIGAGLAARSGGAGAHVQVLVDQPHLVALSTVHAGVPVVDCLYQSRDPAAVRVLAKKYSEAHSKIAKIHSQGPPTEELFSMLIKMLADLKTNDLRYSGGVQTGAPCGHGVSYLQVREDSSPIPILECNWLPDEATNLSRPVGIGVIPWRAFVEWASICKRRHAEPSSDNEPQFLLVKFDHLGEAVQVCAFSAAVLIHNFESLLSEEVAHARVGAGAVGR